MLAELTRSLRARLTLTDSCAPFPPGAATRSLFGSGSSKLPGRAAQMGLCWAGSTHGGGREGACP